MKKKNTDQKLEIKTKKGVKTLDLGVIGNKRIILTTGEQLEQRIKQAEEADKKLKKS